MFVQVIKTASQRAHESLRATTSSVHFAWPQGFHPGQGWKQGVKFIFYGVSLFCSATLALLQLQPVSLCISVGHGLPA